MLAGCIKKAHGCLQSGLDTCNTASGQLIAVLPGRGTHRDIKPPGSHVAGNQHSVVIALEAVQRFQPGALLHACMCTQAIPSMIWA